MNLGLHNYIPCLRWKQGEYQALMLLSAAARSLIFPLIDVAEMGFDFETKQESKSIDEHLKMFSKRVKAKWGLQGCFIDMHHIDRSVRMQDGVHPLMYLFGDLRSHGVPAVPVTSLRQDRQWQESIGRIASSDNLGLALRVTLQEAVDTGLSDLIARLLRQLDVPVEQIDLLIDEEAPNFDPNDGFVDFLEAIIDNLPTLDRWRSFALIGSSIPQSLSVLGTGSVRIPRGEWLTYKLLVSRLKRSGRRPPVFGDYAINHPEVTQIDPRKMTPAANIRYTIKDAWHIVRGKSNRRYGLGQHRDLCRLLVQASDFSGPSFSAGDKYIADCANGTASTGNPTVWRRVGTNHHLEMMARDVANFAAS